MNIVYSKEGDIGRIVLSNPPHGALNSPVFAERDELVNFFADRSLKGVLLSGDGNHFCSGADPELFARDFSDQTMLRRNLDEAKRLIDILRFAPVPLVAVIRGSCLGAGLEIGLCCHFRFAAKSAMLGFPESSHKLLPGMGGTVTAQNYVSRSTLMELILTGRLVGAGEALELGLIDRVCKKSLVEEEAMDFVKQLTSLHSAALIRAVLEAVNNGYRLPKADALRRETELFCEMASMVRAGL